MAFFEEQGELVRNLWPCGLGRPAVETEGMLGVPTWRVLPTSYDALCDRVGVEGAGSRQPSVILSQTGLENQQRMVQLSLRLQGVVAEVSLGATGNWRSTSDHIPKAVQYLTLHAGEDVGVMDPTLTSVSRDAFAIQRRGVLHVEAIVRNALGLPSEHDLGRGGKINMRRRVFTKVRSTGTPKAVSLGPHEDPGGKVKKFERDWIVDHRVKTAVQQASGKFMLTNPLAIRRGDFVDVAALFTIVIRRGRYGSSAEVMLAPLEVVRLRTASEVKALLRTPEPVQAAGGEADTMLEVVTGFDIDGNPCQDELVDEMEEID